jgi:phosphoglycerate dehydrogenase-like enzyme
MTLTIASQFAEAFNERLRQLPLRPRVIAAPRDQPWNAAAEADILLVGPTNAWLTSCRQASPDGWPGKVRWVFSWSAGVDGYPRWLLDAPFVTCGRGVASSDIADYVIAAIYQHSKNLEAARVRSRAQWQFRPVGSVIGSTIGILGFGTIGTQVASRARALGAAVIAVRRRALPSNVDGTILVDDPAAVVAVADHIVVAMPLTSATHKLVDARLLAHAKPSAHLINVSRGGIIDQHALIAALDDGRLGFATLDVTDPEPLPEGHPLWTHPKVRLTPHISTASIARVSSSLFDKFAADLARFAHGEAPPDLVDPVAGY